MLTNNGGVYLLDNDIAPVDESTEDFDPDITTGDFDPDITTGDFDLSGVVMPYAVDPESGQRLWELSVKLLA